MLEMIQALIETIYTIIKALAEHPHIAGMDSVQLVSKIIHSGQASEMRLVSFLQAVQKMGQI